MRVTTVDEIGSLDRRATTEFGVSEQILMENAGEALYYVILREMGIAGRRFAVVCGMGNNGGDGFVVARKIHTTGGHVETFVLGDPEGYGEAARVNYEMLSLSGAPITIRPTTGEVARALSEADVVVDGVFGTGITREVGGQYREVIEAINASGKTIFSVDIPSGVDGNTGAVRGAAVEADYTVTFGLPKRGNLLYPGAALGGRLFVTHISYPRPLSEDENILVSVSLPSRLPERTEHGHKGTFGDVLFIAGARNYFGAPAFSALSLLKAGGGYSRLAAPRSVVPSIASIGPEIVFAPQVETESGTLALEAEEELIALSELVDFVVLGPGLSVEDETQELVRRLVPDIDEPILIDGDGLTAIASDLDGIQRRTAPTVLTPHPGEMSRITGIPTEEILADPIPVVQGITKELDVIVVLKGAHSLIGLPDGRVFINPSGNSGMASAGSGDVLTGTVAAAYGLGLPLEEAVRTGVFLHGFAGDLASGERGEDGITARDILENLPDATLLLREQYDSVVTDFYGAIEVI
jgi:NAD(P)H-hydrate epimerase